MSLTRFDHVLKLFRTDGDPTPAEREALFREVVLMVLARATSADYSIERIELEAVRLRVGEVTGIDVGIDEIQAVANSHMFEREPLERYLAGVARKLNSAQRATLLRCLADVIHCDQQTNLSEVKYFDKVARALDASPSEIAGLVAPES